jgi:hypothetical protein
VVDISDVREGACYRAKKKGGLPGAQQGRRVILIRDGYVHYESWGLGVGNSNEAWGHKAKIETFARDVEDVIECPSDLGPIDEIRSKL